MSDDRLDALAGTARNRGLKLIRSRVRTPGKRGFGKVGLADKAGKPVFGMDDEGPAADPGEVEYYLRNIGAQDWGASLDVPVAPRKKKPAKTRNDAANDAQPGVLRVVPAPKRESKPKPPPEPKLRAAKPGDAKTLVALLEFLGHPIGEKALRKNLTALAKLKETPIVATLDKQVIGLIGVHKMTTVHRDAPVGRIPVLVVAEAAQGHGIGRMLVAEAERLLKKAGCTIVEVTSNDSRARAHAFYRHLGYQRTSIRFMKKL